MSAISQRRVGAVITHNDLGGAQQAIIRLCAELQRRGYQVELVFLYRKGTLVPSNLPHRFMLNRGRPSVFDYAWLSARLITWIIQFRPSTMISFLPLANVLAQTAGAICRVQVRIASQRNPVDTYTWPMRILDWYVGTCGSYSHNVVNSTDVLRSLAGYPWPYRHRMRLVYNGVPAPVKVPDREDSRQQLQLRPSDIALVSAGRLTQQKNHVFLIQLLGALKPFVLLIAGDGPDEPMLRKEAERMGVAHRVRLLGELGNRSMTTLFSAADIFALPSIFEGQSNSLLEAMALGIPIVASDLACHRETLWDGESEYGYVIPITEPDRWIATMSDLGRSAALRTAYGERARERMGFFSLERMCSGFEACFSTELKS